ncbi:MAG: 4Fe-4S binding protein [Candidatus Krumholzibacteriota bacterium]|nr:4Fe-4S binding protein [Candidatus Krumholzibacteriota bacterium]
MINWHLKWALISLIASIVAGFLVRFESTRRLKTLFLLLSIVILGFYNGACPCPIQSLMNVVRISTGKNVKWQNLVFFIGLLPVTWFFGRIYCGWICHMGALQEFIFLPSRFNLLRSSRAQKILRYARYVFLAALVSWVAVKKFAVWCLYDPFRVAFKLSSYNLTGWILLGLLLLSSLFIYRPFCRGFCPIGLILGWVTKIPGARVIGQSKECTLCMACANKCRIDAIVRDGNSFVMDNQECVVCGDCLDACRINGLGLYRKDREHPGSFSC